MAENLFASFSISGQGMSVQRQRLSSVAKNIANANTTVDEFGKPYQREVVVVRAIPGTPFEAELDNQIALARTTGEHSYNAHRGTYPPDYGVLKFATSRDNTPPRLVHDPGHPHADENGYVRMPNINIVTEMVEMISAQRSFEANTGVIESAKNIARNSLEI
ncbi:MAG: flagellar basal body rod protein FlgC [Bacteroidota bacterium]